MSITYDVRIWSIREYKSKAKKRSTYRVRWSVAGREFGESFQTRAMAESFRSKLLVAQREGTAFDEISGLPEPMAREMARRDVPSLFAHACAYAEMKWPRLAPKARESIADGLTAVLIALLPMTDAPSPTVIRRVLRGWAFNVRRRQEEQTPPAEWMGSLAWVERHSPAIHAVDSAATARKVLDSLTVKLDGTPAAATTVARRRAVFHGLLQYAVELGYFDSNPLRRFTWQAPTVDEAVDKRVVVNHDQARALLTAVAVQGETGRRMVAFFACMYYAAMRPAEVIELRKDDLVPPRDGELGELILNASNPAVATGWTDDGRRSKRPLKHRSVRTTRPVPCAPELWELLQVHIETFGTAPDGRLFRGARGGPVPDSVYSRVWQRARQLALTPAEVASPLAARPYDLRHAAVSTWLNAGIDAAQVAEWAGHSVNVLLRVYAKCVVGRDRTARRRLAAAFGEGGDS